MQVLHGAFAIGTALNIDHMHSGPGGAVMHAGAGQGQIMTRIAAVQGDGFGGFGEHVLDERAGEAQAVVIA